MSMTPVIFTDVPYILTAVGLYVNDYCDLYGRGTGLSQEPQLTNLLSNCSVSGFCMFQDSVPAGSYNDPFLSSVIPMVAPTWCHRASWGNLLCGVNADRFDLGINNFN